MRAHSLLLVGILAAGSAFAQTPPSSTSPSSASSPHQRESTTMPAQEAPAQGNVDPAATSTSHQKQVTQGADKKTAMKDCMAKEQAASASLSKSDAEKKCMAQSQARKSSEPKK